ncbi:alpha/beta fold hydrolase [Bradyrhizobium sp. U87765 SZCCT0131]|uniref:alpha/beta fold hydrolase n=1 Tax=unclassified Bradyrhizobium TaxID=2631580 RepID=UPI001BA6DF72|nr:MULTISPECIES: alpha/beta fold hydrolase [unclassified Bradyrhizobium]MBR1221399.1 alpha/beta fold hydrolase [Bradyrhizobium sp. U87765 SZCCT0131]MBR1264678.1 alpha/beta fold hydrolase [Bradyrhizobium sp. U87765 SZCCT0134]MBR1304416.1 alpha/beta fold hydrolase [Bradyrhizobium sp. U87765 SZCCT0110]MBR1322727.1 alpha/beta fold hydrolase [Bradyrhizobium sp. U87765 SZCCT0109]MBR1346345.1 alpha/beta fold hydrolase [Bradyrhizobium sp. U87765 SZCCT0048]
MTTTSLTAPEREFRTLEGCRIALQSAGRGRPLLYLHGAGGGGWHPFLSVLAERYHVIAPEHPGFGQSQTPEWLDNIHDVAFFYRQLLRDLDLGAVHVVGSSLGGWMALEIAVKDTRHIASLSLVAPAGIHAKGVARPDTFLWSREQQLRHLYHDKAIGERILALPQTPEQEEADMKNRFMTARLAWQPRFYDPHLAKWLHQIDRPIQFLWGADDELIPVAYVEAFRGLLPQAEYTVIPNCGHLPQIEQADTFVQHIDRFVAGVKS